MNDIMTLKEAADFIRVSERTLGDMARRNCLPGKKVGREWRFSKSAIRTWLSDNTCPPEAATPQSAERKSDQKGRLSKPGFLDTAFSENHQRPLHRWVPWIAGFSASFVDDAIAQVSSDKSTLTVLDPFAGVGTTLIEAMLRGHNAIGFELNPYAALACRTKLNTVGYQQKTLKRQVDNFRSRLIKRVSNAKNKPRRSVPSGFRSRVRFFSPSIERQVLMCLDYIDEIKPIWIKDLFKTALGSVMVGFSNYSYEPSLGTRKGAGKPNIEKADVVEIVSSKLQDMVEDVRWFKKQIESLPTKPNATLHEKSCLEEMQLLDPNTVDLLITSPPYLNNYHYIRNTRPQLFWLDMVEEPSDLKTFEKKSFGQFWQTVRAAKPLQLKIDIPELKRKLVDLRQKNSHKGVYGGAGWANYAAQYFNDCVRFSRSVRDVMRPNGTVIVIIGNNILQGLEFPTDRYFADIAARSGFHVEDLHQVRSKRTGTSIVNSSVRSGAVKKKVKLYETAVVLKKKG